MCLEDSSLNQTNETAFSRYYYLLLPMFLDLATDTNMNFDFC